MIAEPTAASAAPNTAAPALDPSKIMQLGMGFWPSKVLLTAVKFELFTLLGAGPVTAKEIKDKLGFGCTDRHVWDWLDAMVSLGFLQREGLMDTAKYSNAPETDFFLDKNKKTYMGGILEMANNRLYNFWGSLEDGLRSGTQQNEAKDNSGSNMDFFVKLYQDPHALQEFMNAMSGIQTANFMTLVNKFDFSKYKTLLDVGGADAWLSIQVCQRHPNIKCISFDLPPVAPLANKKIAAFGLSGRIETAGGDFMKDGLPKADLVTMGNILHGLNEDAKQQLIQKVYDMLPPGGALITIENVIDNDRRQNTFGLLMSLNMLIENGDAFDYTMNDFERWAKKAGFSRTELMPLKGATSAAIAHKD
jgi:hypothetical protein